MSMFRFRWIHKFIRKYSSPIPEENAAIWKQRLSLGYALIAWNAFGFVCYSIYKGKEDWAADHGLKSPEELALSPGQQWAKTLGKTKADVYRLSGFKITKVETNESDNTVEQSENSELQN